MSASPLSWLSSTDGVSGPAWLRFDLDAGLRRLTTMTRHSPRLLAAAPAPNIIVIYICQPQSIQKNTEVQRARQKEVQEGNVKNAKIRGILADCENSEIPYPFNKFD